MKTNTTSLKHDFSRDNYWAKVEIKSNKDAKKKTELLFCVSSEYLNEKLGVKDKEDKKLGKWFSNVVEDWKNKGEVLFRKPHHYDVRYITEDGYKNGLSFLKNKVTA